MTTPSPWPGQVWNLWGIDRGNAMLREFQPWTAPWQPVFNGTWSAINVTTGAIIIVAQRNDGTLPNCEYVSGPYYGAMNFKAAPTLPGWRLAISGDGWLKNTTGGAMDNLVVFPNGQWDVLAGMKTIAAGQCYGPFRLLGAMVAAEKAGVAVARKRLDARDARRARGGK